jgi:transcriptional regulator with XRE-family HTH domain
MTPASLKKWRKSRALTLESMGSLLGVTAVTVSRWERSLRKIPPFLHLALKCISEKGNPEGFHWARDEHRREARKRTRRPKP